MSTLHPPIVCSAVVAVLAACLGERGAFTNRMAQSATTYLARAARQPVRWQPWGRDAFALAARLDRPVLLYIGSNVCRWCTQSDREIYTDPDIGTIINTLFVPVRVDRDERPDVAQHYQAAIEHLVGLRGWPLTVFLTADGSAFFGGTYFPADDPITGRGLKQLLPEIARSYHNQRPSIDEQAALLRELVRSNSGQLRGVLRPSLVQEGLASVRRDIEAAVRNRAMSGSVMYAEATALLLSGDSAARATARRALDQMLDTTVASAGEDPPRLVRAALATTLASAWGVTGELHYRDLGRARVRELATELADLDALRPKDAVFADQESYVIEHLLIASGAFGESAAVHHAIRALDALLQRTYARAWGVRHAVAKGAASVPAPLGLLQDQVQVAAACLAAQHISRDARYLDVAKDLVAVIERAYADSQGGYYDTSVPLLDERGKRIFDDVLPGPNAQMALVLANLASVTNDLMYRRRARRTLEAFAGALRDPLDAIRSTTFLAAARQTLEIP
jgi:uncharacterized protein YyaL (SSP411 family)